MYDWTNGFIYLLFDRFLNCLRVPESNESKFILIIVEFLHKAILQSISFCGLSSRKLLKLKSFIAGDNILVSIIFYYFRIIILFYSSFFYKTWLVNISYYEQKEVTRKRYSRFNFHNWFTTINDSCEAMVIDSVMALHCMLKYIQLNVMLIHK